jgi:hypothetical protein
LVIKPLVVRVVAPTRAEARIFSAEFNRLRTKGDEITSRILVVAHEDKGRLLSIDRPDLVSAPAFQQNSFNDGTIRFKIGFFSKGPPTNFAEETGLLEPFYGASLALLLKRNNIEGIAYHENGISQITSPEDLKLFDTILDITDLEARKESFARAA